MTDRDGQALLERVRPRVPRRPRARRADGVHGPDERARSRGILVFPIPTVAAMNGHAFGIGALLALAHDQRVQNAERGWFCLPEVDLRMRFNPFQLGLVVGKLSRPTANEAVLSGRRYDGAASLAAGIVDAVGGARRPRRDRHRDRARRESASPARSCRRSREICTPRCSRSSDEQARRRTPSARRSRPEDVARHERTADHADALEEPHAADEDQHHSDDQRTMTATSPSDSTGTGRDRPLPSPHGCDALRAPHRGARQRSAARRVRGPGARAPRGPRRRGLPAGAVDRSDGTRRTRCTSSSSRPRPRWRSTWRTRPAGRWSTCAIGRSRAPGCCGSRWSDPSGFPGRRAGYLRSVPSRRNGC